jgi:polyferredoxin
MAKKKKSSNIYRKTLQLLIVLLLAYMVVRLFVDPNYLADFESYCPLGGMLALSSFLANNSLACNMTELQIFMGLALIAGVILFSKLFCSYICPIGTFTEWLGKIGVKFKMQYTIKGFADRTLRILKYALLFVTFYFTVSSSELFCKKFDPYYAIFSGFDPDVYLWYAIPAIAIMVLGAIFIRQFWCKYLCPLSAATNIFTNAVMFVGVMAIYFILLAFDLKIGWIWPLAVISILGFLLETIRLKGWIFPPLKITRNKDICTNCKLCDKACPLGLDVSEVDKVNHIDCHLCGDCIYSCPEKGALQINRREIRWLPASATILIIAIGIYLASVVELPTINIRWGNDQQISKAAIYSQSGLKNIKCYGSARSFATKMKKVQGVLGVEAYVQTYSVKIYYDAEMISENDIKKSIFSPTRTLLSKVSKDLASLSVIELGIDKLFDSYDSFYLTQLLKQGKGVFGLSTEFGEPVHARIYFDPDKTSPQQIKATIEKPEVTYKSRGKEQTQSLKFAVAYMADTVSTIERLDFIRQMFMPYNLSFNGYENYEPQRLSIYQIAMPQAMNPTLRRKMQFLVAHISMDSAIVRFQTLYTERPYANIYFDKDKIAENSIYSALTSDTLFFQYSNGKAGKAINPFKFPAAGKILSPEAP